MPGPLYYVVNGQTDANGAASLRLDLQLVPLEWAAVGVVVQCPGAPTVTVAAGGAPIASGGGPNATIGGMLFPPSGGPVTLTIAAAQALAPVQVTVQGWSDPNPQTAQQMGGSSGAGGAPSQIGAQLIDAPLDVQDRTTSFLSGTVAQYGPVNCQTWASFIVFAEPDHQCQYAFLYFADEALTQGMSDHVYNVDGNNGQNLQAIVPNLAPYLSIEVSRLVAGPFTPNIIGFRSQRLLGNRSTISDGSMPVVVSSQNINAGNTLTIQGGGPVVGGPWWYRWVAGAAATFFVTALDDSGNYDTVHLETLTTGSNEGVIDLPDSSVQFNLHNTSAGNAAFSLFAYPVPTGAR